jgi:asparagine synthase (glutamine-hydrolysing)
MMMANSVEGRLPFLDYRVIEFANSLPPQYKLNVLNEKYILKETFSDLIPEAIRNRPKQPYRAPIASCFASRNNSNSGLLDKSSVQQAGIFEPDVIQNLCNKISGSSHMSATDDMAVAAVISTQLIHHHFISRHPLDHKRSVLSVNTE